MVEIENVANVSCYFQLVYILIKSLFLEDSIEIWPRKFTQKLENAQSLMTLTQKFLQDIKKSFEYANYDMKIFWISPDTPRNSGTVNTVVYIDSSSALP